MKSGFFDNLIKQSALALSVALMMFLSACGDEKKVDKKPEMKVVIGLIKQELDKNIILKDLLEIKEINLSKEVVSDNGYSAVAEYVFSFKKSLDDVKNLQEIVMLKSAFGEFKAGDISKTSDPYSFIKKDGVWMIEPDKNTQQQETSEKPGEPEPVQDPGKSQ